MGEQDVDRRAREPPTVPARGQVEVLLGGTLIESALSRYHLRLAGAHPLGLAELVRSVREEIFAGRDDGDVGARELLELPGLCGEGDSALDPSGQDLRHHLCIADTNVLFHGESRIAVQGFGGQGKK